MNFLDFESMNETDVREIVVRPLLERLGYRHGSNANIRTEVTLRYANAFLGRKNAAKDPPLAGRADYVCDAVPYARWVIEVKPPNQQLTTDVREQTHTYAAHPEIAAAYFLITNGRRFELYRTSILDAPVLAWDYDETDEHFLSLLNLVSPMALGRLAKLVQPDAGKPLGIGLASKVRILGGTVTYEEHTSNVAFLREAVSGLTLPITGGFVERTDDGRIHAHVDVASAAAMVKGVSRLDDYDFFSASEFISSDLTSPTIFQNHVDVTTPKGTLISLPGFPPTPSPFEFRMRAFTEAVGFVDQNRFKGTMRLDYDITMSGLDPFIRRLLESQLGPLPERPELQGAGSFDLEMGV